MKKVLILGGYGFIGSHLAQSLYKEGYKVFKTSRYFKIDSKDEESFQSDYSENSFIDIFEKNDFDLVFFLSGNPYPGISENNSIYDIQETLTPLINLLSALAKIKFQGSLWYASSVAVYGKTMNKFQSESDKCNPLSSYAIAKSAGEEYLKLYARNHDLSCGSLRIFSTFGEGLKRQIVYDLYKKAISENPILEIFGTGKEKRDLCYVKDQVDRIKILSKNLKPYGDIYNVGNGSSISSHQIAKEILQIVNIDKEIVFSDSLRNFDGYQWTACTKKFEKVQENPITDLSIAMEATIKSYSQEI